MDVIEAEAGMADVDQSDGSRRSLEIVCLGCQCSDVGRSEKLLHLLDCMLGLITPCPYEGLAKLSRWVGLVQGENLAECVHVYYTILHVNLGRLQRRAVERGVVARSGLAGWQPGSAGASPVHLGVR